MVHGWMDGWTDGWVDGWVGGRTDGRIGEWVHIKCTFVSMYAVVCVCVWTSFKIVCSHPCEVLYNGQHIKTVTIAFNGSFPCLSQDAGCNLSFRQNIDG